MSAGLSPLPPLPTPGPIAVRQRRSPWSAYRVAVIVIAGLVAAVALHLKLTYDKAIRDAETLVNALTVASEQHIGGSLDAIDSLIEEVAATVREGRQHDPHFTDHFTARLPSFPELRFIGVVGADGRLDPQTWPPQPGMPAGGVDVSGRHYFAAQRDATGPARMVVGEPAVGRASGERSLYLSRPVRDAAGRFAGVVVASVNPDFYAEFLSSILYDQAGSCGLIRLDGRIVARAPNHQDEFGRDIADSDLIRLWAPHHPMGVVRLVARTDGNDKLLSYRVMPEFSLMVTAGVSYQKALGGWTRMAVVEVLLLVLFSAMLLHWTRRIRTHDAQLESEQRQLEEMVAERTEALEAARAVAERRAVRLHWINQELKRLTLVASHHLQEPLRSIVSCAQMVARSLSPPNAQVDAEVAALSRDGLDLKSRLGAFEERIAELTRAVHVDDAVAEPPAPQPCAPPPARIHTARAVAGAIIAALLAGNALQLRGDYDAAMTASENLTGAVVKSIAHHLQASLRRIDSALNDVALAVEDGRHLDPDFTTRMLARMATMPELRMIGVADGQGRVHAPAWPPDALPAQGMDISGQEDFRAQAAQPARGRLVLEQPRPGGDHLVRFSHAILGAQGQFRGMAFATVDPDLYARFLDTVLLDHDGGSAVITLSGRMLARAPLHKEKFGLDIADSDLFTLYLPQSAEGSAHLLSKTDGNDKLLGYSVIGGFPLVATSGYSRAKALAEWKVMAGATTAIALMASAILYLWAHRADRRARSLARHRQQLTAQVAERTAGLALTHRAAELRLGRLTEANGHLHELVELIAAQLQQPLDTLVGRIARLEHMVSGHNDETDRWLSFIAAGGTHLRALLRDYPRFVAALGRIPEQQLTDATQVAQSAADRVGATWGADRIRIHVAPLPTLWADPAMLREVFEQLLGNAAAHAGNHCPITVRVDAQSLPTGWRFTVSDDGPGLPPINSDLLFRAFETAHGRHPDSTGLGLPLCRVMVQNHGGRIWANSHPGEGCAIHFVLPAAALEGEKA